jgi:hypothetical protein
VTVTKSTRAGGALRDLAGQTVVAAAKQRIEELVSRQAATEHAIQDIEASRPQGIRPDEIEAMLDAVPDLRDELRKATPRSWPTCSKPST